MERSIDFNAVQILESLADAFYALDCEWRFVYINRQAECVWKRSREGLLGKSIWDEFPQAHGSEAQQAHFRAVNEGRAVRFEALSPVLQTWIAGTVYPAEGSVGVCVYFGDVSEQRSTESALRESEARHRHLANLAREAIVVHDQGCILDVNTRFLKLFGYSYDEARKLHGLAFVAREHRASLTEGERNGEDWCETVGLHRDGSAMPLEVHAGSTVYCGRSVSVAVFRDPSERPEGKMECAQPEDEFRTVLDQLPIGVIVTDAQGAIVHGNRFARRLHGEGFRESRSMEEYGQWQAHHPNGRSFDLKELPLTRVLRAEDAVTGEEMMFPRPDGSWLHVSVNAVAVRDEDGKIIAGVATLDDLAARQRAEYLTAAIREAHHRIGNHLQAVTDLLYLGSNAVGDGSAGKVLEETIRRIQAIGEVHGLLTHETDFEEVDAGRLVDRLVSAATPKHPRLSLRVELMTESASVSSQQATALALIVNELVGNAVRHAASASGEGRVSVRLFSTGTLLRLTVEDNGPGLPPGFNLEVDGRLGLQIARVLAQHTLGGSLEFHSNPGLRVELSFVAERRNASPCPPRAL